MKTIIVIPVHLASKRLPRKVLLEIGGKTILQHVIERVSKATKYNEIWIATTKNKEDDDIVEFLEPNGKKRFPYVHLFRGQEEDIVSRLVGITNYSKADIIINVDAEQPNMNPWVIDKTIQFIEHGYQFFGQVGIHLGHRCYGFSREFLKLVWAKHKGESITDNWWRLFEGEQMKEAQYCVDNLDDYNQTKTLMEKEK